MIDRLPLLPLVIAAGLVAGMAAAPTAAEEPAAAGDETGQRPAAATGRTPMVPPVPDGTPQELLAYIERLADPDAMPKSRGRQRYYLRKAAGATVEATDRMLAATAKDDPLHTRALALKFDALRTLEELGEPNAPALLAAFAASAGEIADPELAAAIREVAVGAEVDAVIDGGRPDDALALANRLAARLRETPGDAAAAGAAARLASRIPRMPGGGAAAAAVFETLLPILEQSDDPGVRQLAASLAGTARRLALPGNPMKVTGTLLSGAAFDQTALAGKVVLVDFWATWCGPCVAEMGTIQEAYEKWHERGFEVVGISLDQDRGELERFLADRDVPWPVLFEEPGGPGWRHPLADYYGISEIPTTVLIGRDGNVVTLDARGKKLDAALERLLGEPPARLGDRRP